MMKNDIGCTDASLPLEVPHSLFQPLQVKVYPETPKAPRRQLFRQLLHPHRPQDSLCLRPLLPQYPRLFLNHLPGFPRLRFPVLLSLSRLQLPRPRPPSTPRLSLRRPHPLPLPIPRTAEFPHPTAASVLQLASLTTPSPPTEMLGLAPGPEAPS
jgi:hypothetical protein